MLVIIYYLIDGSTVSLGIYPTISVSLIVSPTISLTVQYVIHPTAAWKIGISQLKILT